MAKEKFDNKISTAKVTFQSLSNFLFIEAGLLFLDKEYWWGLGVIGSAVIVLSIREFIIKRW